MDIFGEQWRNHDERIRQNWNAIAADDDLLLIAGDVSWAMHLDEAQADLHFLATLRGRKLLLKGNHDYWWGAISRVRAVAPAGIDFLQNDAHVYGGVAVVGARGWILPDAPAASADDRRIFEREVERFRMSLAALPSQTYRPLVAMTHYPPLRRLDEGTPMTNAIEASGTKICVYGHLHGADIAMAPQGSRNGVEYKLVSADAVSFMPWRIPTSSIRNA